MNRYLSTITKMGFTKTILRASNGPMPKRGQSVKFTALATERTTI
ncbi:hypothetical protein ACHAWC_004664 [Mediolabrus comicus]